jgi:hypothetical protein
VAGIDPLLNLSCLNMFEVARAVVKLSWQQALKKSKFKAIGKLFL